MSFRGLKYKRSLLLSNYYMCLIGSALLLPECKFPCLFNSELHKPDCQQKFITKAKKTLLVKIFVSGPKTKELLDLLLLFFTFFFISSLKGY